ncbi:hypothetical protein ACSXBG_17085 (plasmid) [Clostridium perfringens]
MKYYNVKTKEIREFTQEELESENHHNQWIEHDIILNKIVVASINDYRIFPKDELGLNKRKILPLLEYFKPVSKESAFKIAKYYKVCPYCLGSLEDKNNILILDCREDFSNIKKMQLDVYNEVSCCNNTYLIPFSKTKSTKLRADFIKNELEQGKTVVLKYSIKSLDIEILIDLVNVLELNLKNDYEIMRKIFKDKSYLAIKDGCIFQTEDVVIDDLERQILYYLSRR